MKHILTTIAAVVLVGCGPSVDIHKAAGTGNMEAVKQHIAAGTDLNAKNKYGRTPLHRAAGEGHKEIAELLIAKGADVNPKVDGWTLLYTATLFGHKEIAELLLANGADVNAKSKFGRAPLHIAAIAGHNEIVEWWVGQIQSPLSSQIDLLQSTRRRA